MDTPSSGSFVASARLFARGVLVGFGQVCLCPNSAVGAAVVLGAFLLSPRASGLALLGAVVATAWPFWRQQDVRLLETGWYGANGALFGLWSSWCVTDLLGSAIVTALGATLTAWMLDTITFPLGDAPLCLPPLSAPFVIVVLVGTLALPSIRGAVETASEIVDRPPPSGTSTPWGPPRLPQAYADRLAVAWGAYGSRDYARAQELFGRLTTEAPGLADAHNGLGWAAFRQGILDDADRSFRRAIERDARHPYALDGLGWVASRRGRLDEAARRFAAARDAAPGWVDPHDGLGWVAYARGRYRSARAHFRRALERDPGYADALSGLGWTSLMQRRPEEARHWLKSALASDPRAMISLEGLGWALAQSGRAREGERAFLDVLRQTPSNEDALFGLADSRRRLALQRHWSPNEPVEWSALARSFSRSAAVLAGIAFAVILCAPRAGFLGVAFAALSAATCAIFAGPAALLWSDLHLQTLAVLEILVGRIEPPGFRALVAAAAVGAAGVAVWALMHLLGIAVPLLAFNIVGLAYLFVRQRLPLVSLLRPAIAPVG